MCGGYYCIGFVDFMLKGKNLLDYTNLFSPDKYEKNDKIILKEVRVKIKCIKCNKYRTFKNPKISGDVVKHELRVTSYELKA